MIQVIRASEPDPHFGTLLGRALGQGIGGGVNAGVQTYLQKEAEKANEAKELKRLEREYELRGNLELKKIQAKNQAYYDIENQENAKNENNIQPPSIDTQSEIPGIDSQEEPINNLPSQKTQSKKPSENIAKANQLEREADDLLKKAEKFNRAGLSEAARTATEKAKLLNKRSLELTKSEQRAGTQQRKEVTESYSENKDYINKVQDQYEDGSRKDAIFERMEQLEDSRKLSDSGMINLLESLGLKPEWLKNPANEEYNKLSLDLLGGGSLQADYGSRVLASEFKVSQQRIPTLSQTPEGRKQIRENLQTMLLPAKLKEERLRYYLDKAERTGDPLPHNLRGKILDDIRPQLEEAYDKFKQRNGRYKVKEGTPLSEDAIEKYYFLSDGNEDKALKMMREDGYDVE